jgi:hypothetical protein
LFSVGKEQKRANLSHYARALRISILSEDEQMVIYFIRDTWFRLEISTFDSNQTSAGHILSVSFFFFDCVDANQPFGALW